MTQWIDPENDPAPQWVGDMAMRESQHGNCYKAEKYWTLTNAFQALCRRIYRTETPPVDPDFERMRGVASVILHSMGYGGRANDIKLGGNDDVVRAALNAWNETVAS